MSAESEGIDVKFARFFADILLTPLEATRIRLVSQRNYATGLMTGFARLAREEGASGLYAGFLPILCKYVSCYRSPPASAVMTALGA